MPLFMVCAFVGNCLEYIVVCLLFCVKKHRHPNSVLVCVCVCVHPTLSRLCWLEPQIRQIILFLTSEIFR
jgi:hypothetical protein